MDNQGRAMVQEAYRQIIGLRAHNARISRAADEFLVALEGNGILPILPEYHELLRAINNEPDREDE